MKKEGVIPIFILLLLYPFFSCLADSCSLATIDPLERSISLYKEGNYTSSLRVADEFILTHPDNSSAWNLKGLVFLEQGASQQAEEAFLTALHFSPDNYSIYFNLGLNAFYAEDLIKAGEYFNSSLLAVDPVPETFFYQGMVYYGLGRYADAVPLFTHATEMNPGDPANWFNLGMTYEQVREFNLALHAYNTAIEVDPGFSKPWFFRGRLYNSFGNTSQAIMSFENYTLLEPEDDLGWFFYARSLKDEKRIDESATALERALKLNPDNQEYREFLRVYSGKYEGGYMEFLLTPLNKNLVYLFFGLLIIFSIISLIRR